MNKFKIIFVLAIVALLSSCGNDELAKKISGSWVLEYNTTDKYGESDRIDVLFSFKYQPTGDYDGTFTEIRSGSYSEDLGGASYQTYVKGNYAVVMGDVILEYDLSTISVSTHVQTNVTDLFNDALDWESRHEMRVAMSKIEQEANDELKREMRLYLREEYSECNDEMYSLDNVDIKGDVLKCNSEIYGPLYMLKVDFSSEHSEDDVEIEEE